MGFSWVFHGFMGFSWVFHGFFMGFSLATINCNYCPTTVMDRGHRSPRGGNRGRTPLLTTFIYTLHCKISKKCIFYLFGGLKVAFSRGKMELQLSLSPKPVVMPLDVPLCGKRALFLCLIILKKKQRYFVIKLQQSKS